MKQVSFKLPAHEDERAGYVEAADAGADVALQTILEQFNSSLDVGLAKNKTSDAEKQAEVRRSTVAQLQVQQAKLRGELDDMLARDLSELDAAALRRRVVQLVMELQASIFRS